MTDLVQRCAAFGWRLSRDGDEWLLLGNGAPAAFRSTASLEAWLSYQEKAAKPTPASEVQQLEMDFAA